MEFLDTFSTTRPFLNSDAAGVECWPGADRDMPRTRDKESIERFRRIAFVTVIYSGGTRDIAKENVCTSCSCPSQLGYYPSKLRVTRLGAGPAEAEAWESASGYNRTSRRIGN